MQILDAALAFALTLLALAGVTTLLMELFHRVLGLKAKQFRAMIDDLAKAELVPLAVRKFLKEQAARPGGTPPMITAVVAATLGAPKPADDMTDEELRKLMPALAKAEVKDAETWVKDAVDKLLANSAVPGQVRSGLLRRVEEMDTDELLKRLGKVKLFEDIRNAGEAAVAKAVARIEETYEEIAAAARDFFTRRAKLCSLIVGILLAFAVNADGYRIFRLYMQEPASAHQVLAQQDKIVKDWQKARDELQAALAALKNKPKTNADKATTDKATTDKATTDKAVAAIEGRIDDMKVQLAALKSQGLPIGYDNWEPPAPGRPVWLHWLGWIVSVLISGLLIGLGGPFWYDIVMKLSQARNIIRGSGSALPATARQARDMAEGKPLTIFAGRTILSRPSEPEAGAGRPAHPRNLAAFEGTQPVSSQQPDLPAAEQGEAEDKKTD